MWLVGGLAIVAGGVAVVVAASLEASRQRAARPAAGVTADELRSAQLPVAWRGYERGHVEALLARAATALEDARRYGWDARDTESVGGSLPSFLAGLDDERAEPRLGDELEDGSGDRPGGLDR